MNEPKTTKERISHAMVSGNLKVSSNGVGDAETLLAVGMAAVAANPAASAALRLHWANDASVFGELRRSVIKEVQRMNLRERWHFVGDQLRLVADQALRHFVLPVCDKCLGRKYETIAETPMLSGRPCRACKGTGERPLMEKYRRPIAGVLNWLVRIEDDLAAAVGFKMRPVVAV